MTFHGIGWARPIAMIAALAVVSSCGLPQVGPNKRQIYAGSVQNEGDAFIVSVNDRVTRATAVTPALGFSNAFKNAATLGSDTIRAGDTLGLTVWENVDDPLLGVEGQAATQLEEVQVMVLDLSLFPMRDGSKPLAIRLKPSAASSPQSSKTKHLIHKSKCVAWQGTGPPYLWLARSEGKASLPSNARPAHCQLCWHRQVA